jgi:protein-S-isoprenylcysteine O-methyltransferase Ste14
MELPDILLVLIGLVLALAAFVIAMMNRRREHALRDRFTEEYDRALYEDGRRDRSL